ncbi:hypothetical protein [Lactobacillus pasteurii]|uniref:ABC superfamily ATP binding cassette transporter n=1 Tax=Lactobacillus pasteurii DSM 23907 = CRBIP 24.76 TaxID=1423790 RepID=I7IZ32_9LACO|nr:hypothetical protein [Lactobacillus pasteurii]TDG77317.1 hypothetical protein C5L33_000760 [Lactobacillus pasteurii]CCI84862.1 ABC superfamily ATP binding cassette transporter [Lactobacillus pasteurii DSM 23907 = CRBIP 24.76]
MKLSKTTILTILCGFLTFDGLAMLFSGLVLQMTETSDFDVTNYALDANMMAFGMIFVGIIMIFAFGALFINDWARLKNVHSKCVKFR